MAFLFIFFYFWELDSTHSACCGSPPPPFGRLLCILFISHQQTLCPLSQHLWFSSLAFLQASWLPAPTSTRTSKDNVLTFSRQKEGSQSKAANLNNVVADCPARRVFLFSSSALVHRPPVLPQPPHLTLLRAHSGASPCSSLKSYVHHNVGQHGCVLFPTIFFSPPHEWCCPLH